MAARAKLTEADRGDIARRSGKGVATAVLAEEFHVSENCIRVTVKKFRAGAGEPKLKLKPPAPDMLGASAGVEDEEAPTRAGPMITGLPGMNITPAFKTAIADMCRQAFEEKIKEALDAIFFEPGTLK